MSDFRDLYSKAYANLGHSLTPRDGRAGSRLRAVEDRLAIRLPKSLLEYYLVAGREQRFNSAFNRLLAPEEWPIDQGKLIFMEENQAVVLWGTAATPEPSDDPPVQGRITRAKKNGESYVEWYKEHEHCSVFLVVMLHWQGTFGGAMQRCGTMVVPAELVTTLDRDWSFVGEVNQMRAYSRPGCSVCFLRWEDSWRIFAGACSKREFDAMTAELGDHWE
jgi:hypothetical protein